MSFEKREKLIDNRSSAGFEYQLLYIVRLEWTLNYWGLDHLIQFLNQFFGIARHPLRQ